MGLDMYLYRYPRYKNYRPEDIDAVQDYMEYMNNPELQEKYTVKQ